MKHIVPRSLLLVAAGLCIVGSLQAVTVEWDGTDFVSTTNGENNDNGPVRTSTAGDDIELNITGSDIFIDDNIYIAADSSNTINVNVTTDAIVSSNGSATENSVLRFNVTDSGAKINVNVDNNLIYQGISAGSTLISGSADNNERLLILVHGGSDLNPAVEYKIADNTSIQITSDNSPSPEDRADTAAEHYVHIDSGDTARNIVRFTRQNQDSDNNATVIVSQYGVMSYIADPSTVSSSDQARYQFDATNEEDKDGRLRWGVAEQGRVNIRSIAWDGTPFDEVGFGFATLTRLRNEPAGGQAIIELVSPSSWGGLFVSNSNATMPKLRSNPFCEDRGTFNLIQPGFIVDENGSIVINDQAYWDYVGFVVNNPILPTIPSDILGDETINTTIKERNSSALFIDGSFNPFATPRATFEFNGSSKMYFRSGVDVDGNFDITNPLISPDKQPDENEGFGHIVLDMEAPLDATGVGPGSKAINILSLEEANTGGTVLVTDDPLFSPTVFKTRTFARDGNGAFRQYAKAAFLNNARAYLNNVTLQHSDAIHRVFANNRPRQSEATYIGGERLCDRAPDSEIVRTFQLSSGASTTTDIFGTEMTIDRLNGDIELNYQDSQGASQTVTVSGGGSTTISDIFAVAVDVSNDGSGGVTLTMTGQAVRDFKARQWRPTYVFRNADLHLNDSAAFTGNDLVIPENQQSQLGNLSNFVFFSNGFQVDQGTGRNLVCGTNVGATAADGNRIVDRDAHIDVQQEAGTADGSHVLFLLASQNDNQITEGLSANPGARFGQFSTHAMYLAHGSNISVGSDAPDPNAGENPADGTRFALTTNPNFLINDSFFSFESQGGRLNKPELSILSGQGGIFVANNGIFELANDRRAHFNVMIGRSFDASVDLKRRLASFGDGFGITQNDLDLTDASQRLISAPTSNVSDLVVDWKFTTKDYTNFTPYIPQSTPVAGAPQAPTGANISSLPEINGRVGQLQIQNSRLGDPAHIWVNGGFVRELLFMARQDGAMPQSGLFARDNQPDPTIAPVGVLVLQDNAEVGIGPIPTTNESSEASTTLGTNGLTIIPNGNARVTLNSDIVIDNTAHIVPGPAFGYQTEAQETREKHKLTITAQSERELRIKRGGTLDLSRFNTPDRELEIAGKVKLVAEPGSRIILGNQNPIDGGGIFRVTDEASVFVEQALNPFSATADPTNTDDRRVKASGTGQWIFSENARMNIPRDAIVGIEAIGVNDGQMSDTIGSAQGQVTTVAPMITDLLWTFEDDAQLQIGSSAEFGGALQVGNTDNKLISENPPAAATVDFQLRLDGRGATAEIAGQGFFGLGSGIVTKTPGAPNNWRVGSLTNLGAITLDLREGRFIHNRIFEGNNENASLLAMSQDVQGISFVSALESRVFGGGNVKRINAGAGDVNPTVGTTNDAQTGIFASAGILRDTSKTNAARNGGIAINQVAGRLILGRDPQSGVGISATPDDAFSFLKMNNYDAQSARQATIYERRLGQQVLGYVNNNVIARPVGRPFTGLGDTTPDVNAAFERGSVKISLDDDAVTVLLGRRA